MSFGFYTFIVILVVIENVAETNHEPSRAKLYLPKHKRIVKRETINNGFPFVANQAQLRENYLDNPKPKSISPALRRIRVVLERLLNKLDDLDANTQSGLSGGAISAVRESAKLNRGAFGFKKRNNGISRWGDWNNWSSCSVSCGKGRKIRWRHCLTDCDVAETEMEEKTCQLPACPPQKLFGIKL